MTFDCDRYPAFCQAPFNCSSTFPGSAKMKIMRHPATRDGHANLNTWCDSPDYYPYMKECIVNRDLLKAAQLQYNWSVSQSSSVDEMDGSYCFMEGHCTNTNVTANTTLEEAEQMCDTRYGHKGWAHWSPVIDEPQAAASLAGNFAAMSTKHTGFTDKKLTSVFVKMACAMGNFHCDVIYCQQTYCKKDHYIKKYSHLAPKVAGSSTGVGFHPFKKSHHHHHG
mmetsp:Transcript_74834/g.198819  ORF Transcript_74834/g.198819 Transcript_74834/m.198819 type:complete len:223 (-) Transcript_74834:160-828(-)